MCSLEWRWWYVTIQLKDKLRFYLIFIYFKGVIVKGPKPESNLNFRIQDKGEVIAIKFSPNMLILGIIRNNKCIEFLNFKNGQPDVGEYTLSFKRPSKFQDFYWINSNDILVTSEQEFEHYQIFPEKRSLKLLKSFVIQSNWIVWSREIQTFVASTSELGSVLNPFTFHKNQFVKLPKFDVDLPFNFISRANNSQQRCCLSETDVIIGSIYNEYYVIVIKQMAQSQTTFNKQPLNTNRSYSEIVLYKLHAESPAKKTNVLKINQIGRFIIHLVDDLIIVHHQLTQSSLIYDIKMPSGSDGYVTFNNPIIKKAKIKASKIPISQLSMVDYSSNQVEETVNSNDNLFITTNNSNASSKSSSPTTSSSPLQTSMSVYETEIYSKNWIFFLPNVVIDTSLCCFWFVKIRLNYIQKINELNNDKMLLVNFLLNRKNSKKLLINVCYDSIKIHLSLRQLSIIFDKINEFYNTITSKYLQRVQNLNLNQSGQSQSMIFNVQAAPASLVSSLLPVIEQYDMYNEILYPLVEDDNWWNSNIKYTLAIIVEYLRSLNANGITIEHYLYKLFVNALIKANKLYELHQYLQYHVLSDSKTLAYLLLSLQQTYPASNQLALDMLKRLGTGNEEIIEVLLSKGLVLSALRFAQSHGLSDSLTPRRALEIAKDLNDPLIFYTVFKYFEERNMRLRANPAFRIEENCEAYIKHFTELFRSNSIATSIDNFTGNV